MKTNLLSQSTLRLLFFVMLLSIPFLAQAQDTTDLSDTEEMNNDCATDNPFLLSFVQSAINNNLVGCTVPNGLQQIEYNDAIYYKITQGLPLLSVPLPCGGFLPITDIRDCNGFTVCTWTAAGIGLNPDFCSDFLDDSLPETTLWGNNHLGPINTPGTFDVTACVGDEIEMFLYLPKEHFSPTSAPSGFFESGPAGPDGPGGAPSEILAPLTNQSEINTGTMDLSEAIDENGALLLDGFLEEDGLLTIGVNGAGSITYNLDIIVYALGEPFERTVSWTINVSLEDGCGETNTVPNPPIFADYPWLNEVINPNDCDGTVVEVYSQGIYEFIYIQTPTGNTFYFQDGTFYCADAPNFSCVAAYGLTNMVTTWTCGNIPESPNTIFTNYWWLNDIVAEDYCTFTPEITVYESGGYHFIYVAGLDGIGTLYFEDGTLYCTDAPNYSCVTAYGFDQVINTWTCESEYDLTAYDEILYICPGDSVTMFP